MENIKCNSCFHKEACDVWVRHGATLYNDFVYSVEDCPYYVSDKDVKEVVHAKWIWKEFYNDGYYTLCCSDCLETKGARENAEYCPNCGAIMDLDKEN